ncbi:MAG TPA: helix-turn-helix transcriptional regulator [Kofleriaceae bacterium]|nr:helix-turn-helix transcriptional regulator [Kofleriaceae bacterium]
MRRTGEPRAYLRHQLADDDAWDRAPSRRLLDALSVGDRLVAGVGLCRHLELFVGLDRDRGDRPFDDQARSILAIAIAGLVPSARNLARAAGLIDARAPLSARELAVLRHLLEGLSEKELAAELGISHGYAHQVVVRIYRKLGARSRGELMARFSA